MQSYKIDSKLFSNGAIVGFFILTDNVKKLISKENTIQLIKDGCIEDWEIVTDQDGEEHLYSSKYSLQELPTSTNIDVGNITIIKKIIKDTKTIGFECSDEQGEIHNYSLNKIWELAKLGMVTNLKAYKGERSRVLMINKKYLEI